MKSLAFWFAILAVTLVARLAAAADMTDDSQKAYRLAYATAQAGQPPIDVVVQAQSALGGITTLGPEYVNDAAALLGWAEAIVDMTQAPPVPKPTDTIEERQATYAKFAAQLREWKAAKKPQIERLVASLPASAQTAYAAARDIAYGTGAAPSALPNPSAHCYGFPPRVVCAPPPPVHPPVESSVAASSPVSPRLPNRLAEPTWTGRNQGTIFVSLAGATSININSPFVVPLSNVGIADARYLNPRNPMSVHDGGSATPWSGLIFANHTVDRTFVVTMTVTLVTPPVTDGLDEAARTQYKLAMLGQCKVKEGSPTLMTCTATLTVYPNTGKPSEEFPAGLLAMDQTPGDLRVFQVRFFDETETPSNPKGYFRNDATQVPATNTVTGVTTFHFKPPQEPDPQTKVTPAASVSLTHEPILFQNKSAIIAPGTNALTDSMHTHFPGAARLDVSQNIGNRANADLSFIFNSSDFGDQNDKGTVTADKYKLSVYALNRITLDFGKYVFATPASKLAINEKGQGGTLTFPSELANVALSYIAKRQGDFTLKDKDLHSAADILLQVTNINVAPYTSRIFRTLNIFALSGRDRRPDDPHSFSTAGGELFFGGNLALDRGYGGSLAVFHNIRTRSQVPDTTDPTLIHIHPHGHGTVALLKATYNPVVDPLKDATHSTVFVPWSLAAAIGAGTPSHDRNAEVDTSYIGDRSAYAPDLIFLSNLVAPIARGADINNPLGTQLNLIGPGLANKLYYSLEYADNGHSLLQAAAHAFGVPDDDIVSKSSRIAIYRYRLLNSLLASRNLGTECDLQFQIETPKAVKVGLGVGYFLRSHALETMLPKNVWSVTTNVSIAP